MVITTANARIIQMSKPKIGQEIRYTEHGKGWHYQLNLCWPEDNGILGVVVSFSSEGRICTVRNKKGETESFIWIFADGLNTNFEWDGKNETASQ